MSLASTLAPFVNPKVRKRGVHYFHGGRVRLFFCDSHRVQAIVSGSSSYDVVLNRNVQFLHSSCSCPYFERDEPCKHIWAAILAADAKGGLQSPDGTGPQRLLTTAGAETRLAAASAGPTVQEADRSPSSPAKPRPRQGSRTPTWRELMQHLASVQPPVTTPKMGPDKEILYVLDLPSTLKHQQLTLEVATSRRKRDGSWGKLYDIYLNRDDVSTLPNPEDRKILSLLAGAPYGGYLTQWHRHAFSDAVPNRCEIPPASTGVLLPLLCATERFQIRLDPESDATEPLAWDEGEPWELWLEVREEKNGDCILTGSLRRSGERLPPGRPVFLLRSGFVIGAGQVSRLSDNGAYRWTALLPPTKGFQVPAADREELLERLLTTPDLPRLDLPESMRIEETRPVAQPRLRLLSPKGAMYGNWPRAELAFLYDGHEIPATAPVRGLYQPEERRIVLRDLEAERRSAARLRALGVRSTTDTSTEPSLRIPTTRVPKAVRALLAEGWTVEAEGKLYRHAGEFKLTVSSGVKWFELRGEADFDGRKASLPELLAALRRGERFITLGDGSLGILPEEWLKKIAPLAGLGEIEGDHLRFKSAQAALLDAWLMDEPEATFDEAFLRARERLRSFAGIAPAQEPAGFSGELRGYQRIGLGWLHYLRDFAFGGCLADDMGLGKTVQVLALLETRRTLRAAEGLPPSLIVVPRSLVFNWLAEAARFTPELRVLDHTGAGRSKKKDPLAGCDLVLITYGTLRRDVAALRQTEFDYLILDEAQAIKNADSQTAKAARLLRGHNRLALTGTPVENHLGELLSLLEFLNPGLLGTSPLLNIDSEELRNPDPETLERLARGVRPFLLRRTKEQVAPELPAKVEQTVFCELPPKQRRLYDELREHYQKALDASIRQQGLGRSKILLLEALLRLRQAACHPGLLDQARAAEPCAKLDLLLPQLQEILAEDHKALVFSQFTRFLALLREQLDREGISYLYLDGQTRDRRARVEAFQSDPDSRLFLISLKAGGLGLNLTAADYVYLLDPWWNPAVESQAIDRTHRIGQTRPVFACRIVARDTVEEKILELQKTKRELADAVIQADQSLLAGLTREDLELLLS
jgi:superfamily II DNA or RNA helicase